MHLTAGLTGVAIGEVTPTMTAEALGSGDVAVLATPALIALCEAATLAAISEGVAVNETSVGTHVDVRHLAPSGIGASVTTRATLESVEGTTLTFRVRAESGGVTIGEGSIVRIVVDRERFLAGVDER